MAGYQDSRKGSGLRAGPRLVVAGLLVFAVITGLVTWFAYGGRSVAQGVRFDSFWLSLTASFIEDAVFFALVGGIVLLMQSRKPGDDTLEGRISGLLNGTNLSPDLRRQMRLNIEKHCAFSPRYTMVITYTGTDHALGAARAVVSNDREVVNGFKDVTYEDKESVYTIFTDNITALGDKQGELMSVQTVEAGQVKDHVVGPMPIPAEGISKPLPLAIPPDARAGFIYKYWIWHAFGADFVAESRRFTRDVEIQVVNASSAALIMHCYVHDHEFTLPGGQTHLYRLRDEQPGKRKIFVLLRAEEPKS